MLPAILGAAAAAAAAAAGYQAKSATGQWYGQTFIGLKDGTKQLALTYDDGPNDPHTLRLMEVLAKHGVRATFFLIGRFVKQRPDIARELQRAGHVIGNHTFTHPRLIFKSASQVKEEILRCHQAITEAVGEHSNLFRPPFGGRRPITLRVVRGLGLEPVMWNASGHDWDATSADHIERKVARGIHGGNVILLHDGSHHAFGTDRSRTVIATDHLIALYKSDGYEFLTVPEMMGKEAASHQPSVTG